MASIIGVETLQHTNGTTAATIDTAGRIKMPLQPNFRAIGTNAAFSTTSPSFTKILSILPGTSDATLIWVVSKSPTNISFHSPSFIPAAALLV